MKHPKEPRWHWRSISINITPSVRNPTYSFFKLTHMGRVPSLLLLPISVLLNPSLRKKIYNVNLNQQAGAVKMISRFLDQVHFFQSSSHILDQ
jgi:hypothetical protein